MKQLVITLFVILTAAFAHAGDKQGGGGWGKGGFSIGVNLNIANIGVRINNQPVDLIKAIRMENGIVEFKLKPFDKQSVEVHELELSSFDDTYLEAFQKSLSEKNWQPVVTVEP